ncbi:MAG: FHA domain-containing protein [Candidatus Nealsonbacteria bacterium]|nr:FHA domain-containing protein [Candidatus Nealsonbacteria bacterium]
MRVVLEVMSGSETGRKALLGIDQTIQVGRTEWADFSVVNDPYLSGVHFALETDLLACYLRDLGSSNGTLLNGQPVTDRTVLHNGDEICAGQTRFIVQTEGDAPEQATRVSGAAVGVPGPEVVRHPPVATEVAYAVETCNSALTLCRGNIDEISPADLAAMLAQEVPLYLIADLKKLAVTLPEGFDVTDGLLFDWLEPSAAAMVSPVVLAADEFPDWRALVEQGWGADAVICLFSSEAKDALLAHLRRSARAQPAQEGADAGIVGYCWPSVMAPLLSHYSPESVRQLLGPIEAVLVELPDLPDTWQLYGQDRVAGLLDRLGLVRTLPEEIVTEPSEDMH